jgi:hypothetical protein
VAAFAGLTLAFLAAPAWAGQMNLDIKTTITTIQATDSGTVANTDILTQADTVTGTYFETATDTVLRTSFLTETGSIANTLIETYIKTQIGTLLGPIQTKTILNTVSDTDTGTIADTAISTLTNTRFDTITATGFGTALSTAIATETGSILNTLFSTVFETVDFHGQPADVSIEISQEGLNLSSPFANSLKTGLIVNKVNVIDSAGLTQVAAQAGNANVSVGTNSILDGPTLVDVAQTAQNAVAVKELGVLTLVPGFAIQNSTKATTAHIAGLALAAAEATAALVQDNIVTDTTTDGTTTTTDEDLVLAGDALGDVVSVATAVDIVHSGINEYSPNNNVTLAAAAVMNNVNVRATSGVSQVQAQAGSANVAGSHNLLLINGTFNANGQGLNFNR